MSWFNQLKSAAGEVFSVLDSGYREAIYEEALTHELRLRGIAYERQRNFKILYKSYKVSEGRVDLMLNPLWAGVARAEVVVERKVVEPKPGRGGAGDCQAAGAVCRGGFYRDEEELAEQVLEFAVLVRHFGL